MATFRIVDELNTPILTAETSKQSGLGRYLPAPVVELMALRPLAKNLGKRLADVATDPVAVELAFARALSLGDSADLSLDAGVRAGVGVHQADELLFPADDLRDAIPVPSGTAYVSVGMAPRLKMGVHGEQGPLAFGFAAGSSLSTKYFQPFDIAAGDATLADALADTLQRAVIPADIDDLRALPAGSYASVEGEGEIQLAGAFELSSITNPLATPGLPVIGSAKITTGASVSVGAEWRASGAFELRVTRAPGGAIRLSYYRKAGSALSIEATAAFGVQATVRDKDLLRMFLQAVSADPEADLAALVNANLTDEQIETLQKAIAASVDRSIRAAAELQFSSVRKGEALVAFEVDLDALDQNGRAAVTEALRGRLSAIDAAAGTAGIRALRTGLLSTRERRVSWRINLFGILNVLSVAELVRKGSLSYDPTSGTLNAADEIASKRILVKTRPFEADGDKVRKLVFESVIVTAAYRASRLTSDVSLGCACSYFESRRKTDAKDVRADFNAIIGLGLADEAERDRRMHVEHEFGPSTFLLDCTFDANACDAMFVGAGGACAEEHYERLGRDAMLALIPADDAERGHRRAPIENDASWKAMTALGPARLRQELPGTLDSVRAEHVVGDYVLISWWADAMHRASKALLEMRQFLNGRSAAELMKNDQFLKQRKRLEEALASVVQDSKARFGDPWGVLALDAAANRTAAAQATIFSPKLMAVYSARSLPAPRAVAAIGAVSREPAEGVASPREAERPFTADEREIMRRHVVNLRLGALSTDGAFQTDETDVQRLFTELLPAEIAARKASGQKARLVFYAHGGLIEERAGLLPVLARLKFWRQNNIYPVFFVWETGLKETLTDIVRGLTGARSLAARGIGEDLADAVLEVAARQAGRPVWSQMKRSAEVSVLEGGGALLVAQQICQLWNALHGDVEMHAIGHSAGAIFHSYFVPCLTSQQVAAGVPALTVKTMHLLAPAITTALFKSQLKDLVGAGKAIQSLTMYTMNKNLEQEDTAGPYRKSLLYLVSRSFETDQPTPILGLEESLRRDVQLIRFFGLAGQEKQADLLFSKTPSNAPLTGRTEATRHGGFDDDVLTMNSVARRVLDVPDSTEIVPFFQESVERALASAPAASTTDTGGARRALCVGIDKYGDPYNLAGCVNDAAAWRKTLQRLGFDVTLLQDEAASREGVLAALQALVWNAAPGDVIVFQFAGHGTQVDDLDGDEREALDEAFCPVDFTTGRLIIDDDVRAVIADLKEGVNLTCFIDCCHSGTITRALVPGGRPGTVPAGSRARYIPYSRELSQKHRQFREQAGLPGAAAARGAVRWAARAAASGVEEAVKDVCFSACQPHEVAYEHGGAGRFTTNALRVLAGGAQVTNAEFAARVTAAFGQTPPQHPYLDCPDDLKGRGLLQPYAAGSGAPGRDDKRAAPVTRAATRSPRPQGRRETPAPPAPAVPVRG